jgi:hypothetical protein
LLHTPREPVISPDLVVFLPQVQGYNNMRGKLVKEDLIERDDNYQVIEQELFKGRKQEPDIILELTYLLLTFIICRVQYD